MNTLCDESKAAPPPRLQNIAVPEDVHRALKIAAIRRGSTLRDFVVPVLRNLAMGTQPTANAENKTHE